MRSCSRWSAAWTGQRRNNVSATPACELRSAVTTAPSHRNSRRSFDMAIIGKPVLTIAGSTTVGSSDVTASYTVTFDEFDTASDQPYKEVVKLFGVDAGEPG